ncbi:MAG: hypothetical protein B6242_13450 [Anaerolineaceae bacterium 4572_78]|nr:MAG: hypothetical protein B6242_13450 [Anaerolineaceae bacterium 4572_78]
MLNFSECTLIKLDDMFGLEILDDNPILQNWLTGQVEINDFEERTLYVYQEVLKRYVHDWYEIELLQHFIGPMFTLVNFSSKKFGIFSERYLEGVVDDITLKGNPDGMIASGFRQPKKPYFCFQEYKKHRDPHGDPAGQGLAAMLVGQEMNGYKHPLYGCYVIGADWYFMVLEGKMYSISSAYVATREDIFNIFRILKCLKQIIIRLVEE